MDITTNKWKSTIVFFSLDALGHIHPILSIVKELRRRQCRAIIVTTRPLNRADTLQSQGFELVHCLSENTTKNNNDSRSSEEALEDIMRPLAESFRKGQKEAYEGTYKITGAVGKYLEDMIVNHDAIESKIASLKPDLIVCDHVIGVPCVTYLAPKWVRVYSGFPSAIYSSLNDNYSAGLGLKMNEMGMKWKIFERDSKFLLRQKLRNFWKSKALVDWQNELDLSPTSPYLNFYFGPRELGLERIDELEPLPSSWYRLEHTIDDVAYENQENDIFILPENFSNLPGKLIYFSLGTLVTCDTKLINRLLSILSKSPNKFIVSMGQMYKQIKLYSNMWGQKFVNQRAVLQRADLFLTHGGHNSIIESFYYGVPGLIVLPVFADQFDSAQRIEDCGFGFRLHPFKCSERELLNAIETILSDEKLKRRTQEEMGIDYVVSRTQVGSDSRPLIHKVLTGIANFEESSLACR